MNTVVDEVRLSNGETARIIEVFAPDSEYRERILTLLSHKGGVWEVHLAAALDGMTDALETRWYIAELNGRPAANVMLVERHGVAILGHVFTREEHRRKGLCRLLLQSMMDRFRERKGRSIILGTGFQSVAYHIYESFGFRSLRGGLMGWYASSRADFESEWFASGPAVVRPARWEHWPLVASLATFAESVPLRSAAWGLRDIGNLEGPYCDFMARGTEGGCCGAVAQTEIGAVVACATCVPFRLGMGKEPWPGVWLVDVFSHPLHTFKMAEALTALRIPEGKAIAFITADDEARHAALAEAGFEREGLLADLLLAEGVSHHAAVYGKRVRPPSVW
jgi:GNAT superfamily N-acetyltransferase